MHMYIYIQANGYICISACIVTISEEKYRYTYSQLRDDATNHNEQQHPTCWSISFEYIFKY